MVLNEQSLPKYLHFCYEQIYIWNFLKLKEITQRKKEKEIKSFIIPIPSSIYETLFFSLKFLCKINQIKDIELDFADCSIIFLCFILFFKIEMVYGLSHFY